MPRMSSRTAADLCCIAARFLFPLPPVAGNQRGAQRQRSWQRITRPGLRRSSELFWRSLRTPSQSERENIRKVLVHYVDSFSDGNRIAAAEMRGLLPKFLPQLVQGRNDRTDRPNAASCYELKIPLTSLVTGATGEPEATVAVKTVIEAEASAAMRPVAAADQIRAALRWPRKEHPAPSIREVAQRLGYSTPTRLYQSRIAICAKSSCGTSTSPGVITGGGGVAPSYSTNSIMRKALEESLSLAMPATTSSERLCRVDFRPRTL